MLPEVYEKQQSDANTAPAAPLTEQRGASRKMSACDETPALGLVVSTVGVSLAGCVLVLAVACRMRTFELRLTACLALSVLVGLPVWLLPSDWCTSQALLEEFSYLSSMLWAVICLVHVYLVVNTGLRVA